MSRGLSARLLSPTALQMRRWDVEAVLYDSGSDQTHLLAYPVDTLIDALAGGPCAIADLDTMIAGVFDLDLSEASAYVGSAILSLRDLGLIDLYEAAE